MEPRPMYVRVLEVSWEGIVVQAIRDSDEEQRSWLPSSEWGRSPEWSEAFDCLEARDGLDVVDLGERDEKTNLPMVSRRKFRDEGVDASWLGMDRVMRVTSYSRSLIRGTIGPVQAVIRGASYDAYQNLALDKNLPDTFRDHSAPAVGDYIGGIVVSTHSDGGVVELDPMQYIEQEDQEAARLIEEIAPARRPPLAPPPSVERALDLRPETLERIFPLLIVEDDPDYCETLAREFSCGVRAPSLIRNRSDAEALTERLRQGERPDCRMAIVDISLSREGDADHAGLDLAHELARSGTPRIFLVSSEDNWPTAKRKKYGGIPVHGYLRRPYHQNNFVEAFELAAHLDRPRRLVEWLEEEKPEERASARIGLGDSAQGVARMDPTTAINHALHNLTNICGHAVIHVFKLHPRSWRAESIAENVNGRRLSWRPFRGKIFKSRIRDTVESQEPICETVAPRSEDLQLWTQQMMEYQSFCGVPITAHDGMKYALTCFHAQPNAFDTQFVLSARVCAERVGRALDFQRLTQRRRDEMSFAATGMALEALAHELASDITTHESDAGDLLRLLSEETLSAQDHAETLEIAEKIVRETHNSIETFETLRGVRARKHDAGIQACLRRAAIGCRNVLPAHLIEPDSVMIEVPKAIDSEAQWMVRANRAALTIVFFNLYLNAAQQLDLIKGLRHHRIIWHSIEKRTDRDGKPWAYVRVHDDGPGIHSDDWEQVFEPGYSTRKDGTGIGLHISRHLLGSISESGRRAELRVSRSIPWAGTTFLVKLPLGQVFAEGGRQQ